MWTNETQRKETTQLVIDYIVNDDINNEDQINETNLGSPLWNG